MSKEFALLMAQERLITRWQLENALQAQLIYSGPLIANLIKLGYIDEKNAQRFYSRRLKLPLIKRELLNKITPRIAALVPRDLICTWRIIPVGIKDGRLVVASAMPLSSQVRASLSLFVGLELIVVLTSRERLAEAVLRCYGISLPPLFKDESTPIEDVVAGLDSSIEKDASDQRKKKLRRVLDTSLSDYETPDELNVEQILSAFPETQPLRAPHRHEVRDSELRISDSDLPKQPEMTIDDFSASNDGKMLSEKLAEAEGRDDIIDDVCSWMLDRVQIAMFFSLKASMAVGYHALQASGKIDRITELELSMNLVSVLSHAVTDTKVYLGLAEDDDAIKMVLHHLDLEEPQSVVVLPLAVKGKTVGFFIGLGKGKLSMKDAPFWEDISKRIGQAFEAMILSRKVGV